MSEFVYLKRNWQALSQKTNVLFMRPWGVPFVILGFIRVLVSFCLPLAAAVSSLYTSADVDHNVIVTVSQSASHFFLTLEFDNHILGLGIGMKG